MRHITKLFGAIVLTFFVLGCATTELGNTKIDDQGKYMQLDIGESEKRDVYLVFGQPHYVQYDPNGKSLWVYKKLSLTPSGWSFVPVYGLLFGGMNKEEKVAYFEFTADGKLADVSSRESGGYVNQWLGMVGAGVNDDEHENAGSVEDEMKKFSLPYDEDRDPNSEKD